jgi:DNA mismatch endonuclease (patch repair protein)
MEKQILTMSNEERQVGLLVTDTISSEARSHNITAIRSRYMEPEIYLRKRLFAWRYRYRRNSKTVPLGASRHISCEISYHTVFMNRCFWYLHQNYKYAYMPKSRTDIWSKKSPIMLRMTQR